MSSTTRSQSGPPRFAPALVAISFIYFIFGFITCLNDILVPHLKAVFALTYGQAALIQFCFFTAYFLTSVPFGRLIDAIGFKRGIVGGLLTTALGCLLFLPAAGYRSYPLFLLALFILASGITLMQVAANPFVALLGSPDTASARLTLAQAFNSLGTTLAPLFGSLLILAAVAGPTPAGQAGAVQGPYLGLALALLVMAAATGAFRLPRVEPERHEASHSILGLLRGNPRLAFGALGIFTYVGAEVAIGSFLVNYLSQPDLGGISLAVSARYVSLYWGGAMAGRFLGSAVMRKVSPSKVLAFNAVAAMALVLASILTAGRVAMFAILAVGFFNSIMFPTIFTLAIAGVHRHLGQASGLLCMAIVGGAVVPLLVGVMADALGLRVAFLLPVLCYAYVAGLGTVAGRQEARNPARLALRAGSEPSPLSRPPCATDGSASS